MWLNWRHDSVVALSSPASCHSDIQYTRMALISFKWSDYQYHLTRYLWVLKRKRSTVIQLFFSIACIRSHDILHVLHSTSPFGRVHQRGERSGQTTTTTTTITNKTTSETQGSIQQDELDVPRPSCIYLFNKQRDRGAIDWSSINVCQKRLLWNFP